MTAPSARRPKAALILGAAVWPDGLPSPTLRRRTLHAVALWRRGEVAHLIGCGGLGRHRPSEAEAIRRLLLEEGVPPEAVHVEDRSTSTHENILFARPILERLGSPRVVIVTDLTHAPRARLIAWALGLRATSSSPSLRGANWRFTARQALRELPATVVAIWRLRR